MCMHSCDDRDSLALSPAGRVFPASLAATMSFLQTLAVNPPWSSMV